MTLKERVRIKRYRTAKKWYQILRCCGYIGGTIAGMLSLWVLLVITLC